MNSSTTHTSVTRRGFLKSSALALSGTGLAAWSSGVARGAPSSWPTPRGSLLRRNQVILFQGDSITDMGREREAADTPNEQPGLGNGYAWLAAAELLVEHPDSGLKVFNRGISGNKVFQLADRWQADCLDLKPDLLSILIGVNDYWHTLTGHYNGTVEIYERDYRALLERTRKALPKVKLVICEPFTLRCGTVSDKWFPAFGEYRAAARRVAEAFHTTLIPFQAMFDQAVKYAPPSRWSADGVHPTSDGASLMAHEWLRTVAGKT
jgi:lysophospholipase L1-like esterase